jgi:hypothetical protein
MRQLRAWLLRFKGLFAKDARERDLADELESHLQLHIDDNIRAGMSPQEARRFFKTLGVAPVAGRNFYAGEDLPEAPRTVILSYAAWEKRDRDTAR